MSSRSILQAFPPTVGFYFTSASGTVGKKYFLSRVFLLGKTLTIEYTILYDNVVHTLIVRTGWNFGYNLKFKG